MRITLRGAQRGSALLVTLITTAVIGISLASYLELASFQNRMVLRSQCWNQSVAVLEAGLEEALTHLNKNSTNLSADGWTQTSGISWTGGWNFSGTYYTKQRSLDSNSYYTVAVTADSNPTIMAQGCVRSSAPTNWTQRVVRITAAGGAVFSKGLVAKGNVSMNGNNVTVDSFDSGGGSTTWSAGIRKANGSVASATGTISAGNADIYGFIAYSPSGGFSVNNNGSIGDLSWVGSGSPGLQFGKSANDLNISLPDVTVPAAALNGTSIPNSTTAITASGSYVMGSITGNLTIRSNTTVTLLVTTSISLSGQSKLVLEPGAKLTLYMDGPSTSFTGQSAVNMATNSNAIHFLYYGTPRNTSVSISGNGGFRGMVYAPSAALSLSGGGNDVIDFSGAAVAGSATMNGHFNFHYDENVGRNGPRGVLAINSWNELGWTGL
jgi:hypothetical protein